MVASRNVIRLRLVWAGVDTVTALLDGHHARGAFLLRCVFDPPWSMRVQDRAAVTLVVVAAGTAWMVRAHDAPLRLDAGDIVVVKGPEPYTLAHAPAASPTIVIDPDQRCRSLDGTDLAVAMHLGLRSWGNATVGETVLLIGVYERATQLTGRLLAAMPPVIVLRSHEWDGPLVPVLCQEMNRDAPGQTALLDRLVDLLMISGLREWFARPESDPPPWWRAQDDAVIGQALNLMHTFPERGWSVGTIAREVGVSRATLARRFADLVGQTPMAYLTTWRLAIAADLLRGTDRTLASVATACGYANPFAFSVAFKRRYGLSPQQFRNREVTDLHRATS